MSRVGLGEVLDEEVLAELAGPRSFARGVEYAADGAVGVLRVAGEAVETTVQGTHAYRVRLGVDVSAQAELRQAAGAALAGHRVGMNADGSRGAGTVSAPGGRT